MRAPRGTERPTIEREGLAHAIVYPAKTKPTEGFKEQSSTCGNADAL